jgi:hypothetical protein
LKYIGTGGPKKGGIPYPASPVNSEVDKASRGYFTCFILSVSTIFIKLEMASLKIKLLLIPTCFASWSTFLTVSESIFKHTFVLLESDRFLFCVLGNGILYTLTRKEL